jgi:P4 family phage/plasmid primase-like protien
LKALIEKNIGKFKDLTWKDEKGNLPSQAKLMTVIVNLMTKNLHIISSEGAIYIFDDKYYQEIHPLTFRRQFREMWLTIKKSHDPRISKSAWVETITANFDKEIFLKINNYPHLVPFSNGYYNFITNEFEKCSKDVYITTYLPLDYTSDYNCPLFIKTIDEILPNKKDRVKFLTAMRYTFTSKKLRIAIVCIGDGNNGKSTLVEFFMKILGKLACKFKIADMKKDRGDVICSLKGKNLAVSSEIGGDYMNRHVQENIKELITDETLSGRAAYGVRDEWINTTDFMFLTNTLPLVKGGGKSYFRRFDFVFFNQDFTGREDPEIFNKIFNQEGSQVISYLLKNYNDLSVFEKDWKKTRDIWNTRSNPLVEFLAEMTCYCSKGKESSTGDIYVEYVNWCEKADVDEIIAKDKFNKHMLRLNHTNKRKEGAVYYFPNLRLLTTADHIKKIKETPLSVEQPEETMGNKSNISKDDFKLNFDDDYGNYY